MKNGEFKIENNVPIPARAGGKGYMAAIRKLKIGQSVELPASTGLVSRLGNLLAGAGAFSVRKTKIGCRIWRIK